MDSLIAFIYANLDSAHLIIFSALILAGFNLPVSEDLMLITSGVLASTLIPEHTMQLFLWTFAGCYLSDWISYALGRFLGPKLFRLRWFSRALKPKKMKKIESFYEKYGFWTLMVGRFIPFGVRNLLFITAGMGRMNFLKFILSDGIACLTSNATLFYLAYSFGKNYELLFERLQMFNIAFFITIFLFIGVMVGLYIRSRRNSMYKKQEKITG